MAAGLVFLPSSAYVCIELLYVNFEGVAAKITRIPGPPYLVMCCVHSYTNCVCEEDPEHSYC